MSRRNGIKASTVLGGLGLLCLLLSSIRAEAGNTSDAIGYGIYAASCFLLLYAFAVRVQCGVTTTRGEPCRNTARGVLLGCRHIAYHRLAKLKARFGLHPVVPVVRTRAKQAPLPVERVVVKEDWRATVTFWAPVLGLLVATVSMTTDVMGLFD